MNYTIVLSGGVGSRLGLDMPKQYYKVGNKPVIHYVLETLSKCDCIDGYVIVAMKEWQECILEIVHAILDKEDRGKFIGFAEPGENRQLSVYHGLLALKETALECNRLLDEYDGIEGENIKLSVRDRVRECVILTLDIHDLKAVKQANEFVDIKRFLTDALKKYDLNKCTEFETVRGVF